MIKLQHLLKEEIIVESYPRDHIKYVLGIDVPLNESIAISPELYSTILTEQEIYENFMEKSKEWIEKKFKKFKGKVVGKVDQYTDLVRIITRAIENPQLIVKFSVAFMKEIYDKVVKAFYKIIDQLKEQAEKIPALKILIDFLKKIKGYVKGIWEWVEKQDGVKKVMYGLTLGALVLKVKGFFSKGVKYFAKLNQESLTGVLDGVKDIIGDLEVNAIISKMKSMIKAAVGPTITAIAGVVGSVDNVVGMLDGTLDKFEVATRD
jgi:hypothetical protein